MLTHRSWPLTVKNVDTQPGHFRGYANVYGIEDLQGDIVDRGAFTKTLAERNGRVRLLSQHDTRTILGVAYLQDSTTGLMVNPGIINMEKQVGKDAWADILHSKEHDLPMEMSIGFNVISEEWRGGARHITEIELWECSLVTFAANPQAVVLAAPSQGVVASVRALTAAFRGAAETDRSAVRHSRQLDYENAAAALQRSLARVQSVAERR